MEAFIYTLDYSNLSLQNLIEKLKDYRIILVIDVRRFSHSKNPEFSWESLSYSLKLNGISYMWLGDLLGGFRSGGYLKYMSTYPFWKNVNSN